MHAYYIKNPKKNIIKKPWVFVQDDIEYRISMGLNTIGYNDIKTKRAFALYILPGPPVAIS